MSRRSLRWVFCLTAALFLLLGCGTDALPSSNTPPSPEELAARLASPVDIEEIRSFRLRGRSSIDSPGDIPTSSLITVEYEIHTEDPALYGVIQQTCTDLQRCSPGTHALEVMLIDGKFWFGQDGQWKESTDPRQSMIYEAWVGDAYLYLNSGGIDASGMEIMPVRDVIRAGTATERDTVHGFEATRIALGYDQMVPILDAAEIRRQEAMKEVNCLELTFSSIQKRKTPIDAETRQLLQWCVMDAADTPPASEYISDYSLDIWVADAGFVIEYQYYVTFDQYPFLGAILLDEGPVNLAGSIELYDFNAPFSVTAPD